LEQIASSLSGEGSVTLEHKADLVLIESGGLKSSLKTVPYEDFPLVPLPETSTSRLVLPGSVLRSLFTTIASCASTSTVRPELSSVYLAIEGGTLTAAATDSFRLAEKKITLSGKVSQGKLLIPAKNAMDIAAALPDEEVIVTFDDHQCAFVFESGMLSTRLTAAVYPDYRQIIPKESVAEATILRRDLEMAVKRATIFSDTFQKVKLAIDPKQKSVALAARNTDVGESIEHLTGQITGNAIELSFNYRYLSAFFPLTGAESITLSASGIGRPLTLRGVGDPSLLYLVMPMNQ
jgi:DNA polymerase-3 subunit beta